MALVSRIGRRAWRVRLTLWAITLALVAGSISMIYPLGLMLAGSTKSTVDMNDVRIVPSFLISEQSLWAKHAEGMFNERLKLMQVTYGSAAPDFQHCTPPTDPNETYALEWLSFLKQADLPTYYYMIGYLETPQTKVIVPRGLREFKRMLNVEYHGDLQALNDAMDTSFPDWATVTVVAPIYLFRSDPQGVTPLEKAVEEYSARQPLEMRTYFSIEGVYREQYLRVHYPDVAAFNAHHATQYNSFEEIPLDQRLPSGPGTNDAQRATWEEFARNILNLLWLRADPAAAAPYREYLQAKYGTIAALNSKYNTAYASFDAAPLIQEPPREGLVLLDWKQFVEGWKDPQTGKMHMLPASMMRIQSVDFLFRDYLQNKFGSVDRVNGAMGTHFTDWAQIRPPQEDAHYLDFRRHKTALRWEFVKRNYSTVLEFIVLHGRALWNTVIYCLLAVLAALTVNPLAAYALSRYKPRSTYRLLMLVMLTMAFPPMVTQIPIFLMLRDLHLLNTFWALVLPGLASGYAIFLLKGFFDSLPQELYESATIDGASEFRIFWQITMSLSKPILAVIALAAFTAAYSNFFFALLLVRKRDMWTLMVWLFDFQQRASEGAVMASLVLAAIPTMIAFVLCQKVIMQGIVVPVEK